MMTEIYAKSKTTSSIKQKEDGDCATSSSNDAIVNKKINSTACKKRAADKTDKKKQDKKRALKRL